VTSKWEVWRLMAACFIHSGFIDLFCNVFIQAVHCGYINQLGGTFKYCMIYFGSGVFGNIVSCIFRPEVVVCGSSGSILGCLSAWAVWILFRWRAVPKTFVWLRNAQLTFCVVALGCTLAWSLFKFNNFLQLSGASVVGLLWGIVLFGNHMKLSRSLALGLRVLIGCVLFLIYGVATSKLLLQAKVSA
jgi:rhomboid protease GluP